MIESGGRLQINYGFMRFIGFHEVHCFVSTLAKHAVTRMRTR